MNYADIKALAAEQGATVEDLIALSANNDPFYVGRPNDYKMANWFHELWRRFGYANGVHLRRVHYQIISQKPAVLLPNRWSFTVTEAIYDGSGKLEVPEGALLISSQYAWKGPRVKDGKQLAGEAVRFLPAPGQSLPPQIREGVTYYVARVGEAKTGGQRYRWIMITDRREYSSPPMRLSPGTGGTLAEPYENTERCWDYLTQAGKVARYLGLVRIDAFVDRRNPEPRIYAQQEQAEPYINVNDRDWETPRLPSMPELPDYSLWSYSGRQRYHLEIWCEKSTMNDVLIPLCEQYQINLVTGVGEMSITSVDTLLKRVRSGGRPVIIWYISDYDPAGQSMPVAVARKIEFNVRSEEEECVDIRLIPLVLTGDQIARYNLPRTPIKETEMRAASFEARHGEGAVELDAMEALYPGELARILRQTVREFYDNQLNGRVYSEERRLLSDLADLQGQVYAGHQQQIDQLAKEYRAIQDQFAETLREWATRQRELWAEIAQELAAQDYEDVLADHPVPEAEEAEALDDLDPLYHSERRYGEQLTYYKMHQRKAAADVEIYE